MNLTLATYNIHACIGADGRFEPDRTVDVLRELDADVVALQEVEHHDVDGSDLLDYLAAKTGLTPIAGPTLLRETRHYGNALLTRLPILAVNRVDLTLPGHEARGAIDVTLGSNGHRMQVVATHLGLKPWERRQQVRQLLRLFDIGSKDVYVLLGDLNEWFLWGRPLRWLHAHFKQTPHRATFPSRRPFMALDRLWVHPRRRLTAVEAHVSKLARIASDHLPLKGIIDL
ncbi:MAG TPA: endonuclease/exonuclease/phosphatase family protein [Nitrosospira sp.]|jgi:endonuclease/exonuclease/phosphatase family metal-dependent hydrolase|nr:endonuclease/exonuclease/phosphatase family protein [Nitrosospira sp.]